MKIIVLIVIKYKAGTYKHGTNVSETNVFRFANSFGQVNLPITVILVD